MTRIRAQRAIQDPLLRIFVRKILGEYRRSGPTGENENLKHVLRMTHELRSDPESLQKIGCDPQILEAAILLSDLGKEPHILEKYVGDYEGHSFRAFLDHSRISMREGDCIRRSVGLSNRLWRSILGSIIGHDGPSIPGSWWKENYERELGKPYPGIHTREALIHCYLDRIDQGGIFRSRSGQLNGGLRKISYHLYSKDDPAGGSLAATITEVFGRTRMGTQDQLDYLDEVEKPRLLGSEQLPKIVREMKRKFIESEKYFERILIEPGVTDTVKIILDRGENVPVTNLNDFWRVLSQVTLKGSVSSFWRRTSSA